MDSTETDRHIEDVKRSFVERVQEIERRVRDARERFDPRKQIAAHPHAAVGIAFAVGALLGTFGGGARRSPAVPGAKRTGGGALVGMIGALAMGAIRSYAMRQLATAAEEWLKRESRETEPMLEH
jgi:hypothetical protein